MKVYKIVFSPTGGTQKVADMLANALGGEIAEIDLSERSFDGCALEEGSLAVIAMPSFGGRAPQTAIERLKMIRGNGAKAVAVAVYGNRAQEDTLLEIADTAKECGFAIAAGISAVAEHSIARQYAAERPNEADAKELRAFAQQILEKISGAFEEPHLPGFRPYKKAGAGLIPSASSACVSCGLCAKRCPTGAIDKTNPRSTDKNACINCMRCVAVCPQKARTVSSVMVKIVSLALKGACSEAKANKLYLS